MPRVEPTKIATNKKAFHDYEILETFEAGIVLSGTEVKALRESKTNLRDTFATVRKGEVWLHGMHVAAYSHGNRANLEPARTRKLLLHRNQIRYLIGKTKEKGLTLVPLRLYFDMNGRVKVELALAQGKKLYDKRQSIAERDANRDVQRSLRERQKEG